MASDHDKSEKRIWYGYKFSFDDGKVKEFTVNLEHDTLNLIFDRPANPPEWTKLEYFKCPNCPLNANDNPNCPVALSITDIIDFFKNSYSYKEVEIVVESEAREVKKKTSLQSGISSLLGIFMVTSGCPVLSKIRPMVRSHLPFSTLEETSFRVLSTYLLAQYFNKKKGKKPDWDLNKLSKIYEEILTVNKCFWQRLSHIKIRDASLNALIILDSFAGYLTFKIDEHRLSDIELLCDTYFD